MKAPKKLTKYEQVARGDLRTSWLPPDREWLYDQYVVQGKSANWISDEVGAGYSGEIVKRWLVLLDVPVRKYRHEMPGAEVLRSLYVGAEMTSAEIAHQYEVDPGTVLTWLKAVGIPRRPTSHRPGRGTSRLAAREYLLASGVPLECAWCGVGEQFALGHKGTLQIHHKDHDRKNNALENLCWMCYTCHQLESRLWKASEEGKVDLKWLSDGQLLVTLRK